MIVHYLKIALRNLAKYKAQNIISIVSLAVGMTVLAVIQCLLFLIRKPDVYKEPYADRCYTISLEKEADDGLHNYTNYEAHLLLSNGGMACVDKLFPVNGSFESGYVNFCLEDSSYRRKAMDLVLVRGDYPNYRGLRSAVTGSKVPVLRKNEVLLSQSMARKVYGDSNPVGSTISFYFQNELHDFVLADVFEDVPLTESQDHHLLFSFYDDDDFDWLAAWIPYCEVILRDGFTPEQLKAEADARLKPAGMTVSVKSLKEQGKGSISDITRIVIWVAGSLILLSALISFLRMQVQLLRMRGRELALRRINGASASNLFLMLLTEYAVTVILSTLLAVVLTDMLIGFADTRLAGLLGDWNWSWHGIYGSVLTQGALMLAICAAVIGLCLVGSVRKGYAISDTIRGSGGMMRKTMLVIQTVISTVFISGTLSLLQFVAGESRLNNIPDNDRYYRKCILAQSYRINDKIGFQRELQGLRHADLIIPYSESFTELNRDESDPVGALLKDLRLGSLRNYHLADTALFDFYGMKISWNRTPEQGESYVLLSQGYSELHLKAGKELPDMETASDGRVLPVLGVYSTKPYSRLRSENISIAVVTPGADRTYDSYILVPHKGEYQALMADVTELMNRFSPESVELDVYNFRDRIGAEVTILDAMRGGALILSAVCLIICAMSLYSTLLLSIRARRKEVAIRKVNGARKADVAILFGRLYISLAVISILISAPIAILFNQVVVDMSDGDLTSGDISAWISAVGGILFMLVVIAVTVWGNIRRIMKLNPVDYIATE